MCTAAAAAHLCMGASTTWRGWCRFEVESSTKGPQQMGPLMGPMQYYTDKRNYRRKAYEEADGVVVRLVPDVPVSPLVKERVHTTAHNYCTRTCHPPPSRIGHPRPRTPPSRSPAAARQQRQRLLPRVAPPRDQCGPTKTCYFPSIRLHCKNAFCLSFRPRGLRRSPSPF